MKARGRSAKRGHTTDSKRHRDAEDASDAKLERPETSFDAEKYLLPTRLGHVKHRSEAEKIARVREPSTRQYVNLGPLAKITLLYLKMSCDDKIKGVP